ncbi:hypothetical protein AB0368_06660 [Actinoplanes sp. NPDC051475]|uniref:hypothetical protein n=1 Tax=Actinoplanes sp. NPDC051475 TaxID=3157225 RepID=UPI00344DE8FA
MSITPVRLPHSGLTVPHTGYTVTSYRHHETHDGVAFTATVRLNNKVIGTIENDGNGGPDQFYPSTADGHRTTTPALEAFAAACTDAQGETPDLELVLGDLVTEYETSRHIARAAKRGHVTLRMMQDHELDDGPMGWPSGAAFFAVPPATAANPDRLRTRLQREPDLAPDALAWWQIWDANASRWNDVTPRPEHLPADPA